MECGCAEGSHVGPGCPIYRGGPSQAFVHVILRVTNWIDGVLYMDMGGQNWRPLKNPEDYAMLNASLLAYRVNVLHESC